MYREYFAVSLDFFMYLFGNMIFIFVRLNVFVKNKSLKKTCDTWIAFEYHWDMKNDQSLSKFKYVKINVTGI